MENKNKWAKMALYHSPEYQTSLESVGHSVQEKKFKIEFQDGGPSSQLGFLIRPVLAIFDLQATPILPTNFPVNWPFGSEEEVQNRFSRWQPSWIFYQNDFSHF